MKICLFLAATETLICRGVHTAQYCWVTAAWSKKVFFIMWILLSIFTCSLFLSLSLLQVCITLFLSFDNVSIINSLRIYRFSHSRLFVQLTVNSAFMYNTGHAVCLRSSQLYLLLASCLISVCLPTFWPAACWWPASVDLFACLACLLMPDYSVSLLIWTLFRKVLFLWPVLPLGPQSHRLTHTAVAVCFLSVVPCAV